MKEQNIIDFDVLDKVERANCKRNEHVLMIKNIPYTVKEEELRELFERYGSLKRFLISPFKTLAIAEYKHKSNARAALKNLAYHKLNYINPIYLEFAPKGLVRKTELPDKDDKDVESEVDEKVKEKKDAEDV